LELKIGSIPKSNIFIAQTDARNDANGKAGTKKHGFGLSTR
jgi:hypothetical protein